MNTKGIWPALILSALTTRAQVLDQQNLASDPGGWIVQRTQFLGQSFRPSVAGNLTGVDLNLARNLFRTGTLTLQVRALEQVGALGTASTLGPALFSHDYSFELLGADFSLVHFPFDSPPALAAGQPYVIILQTDHPDSQGGLDPVGWTFSGSDPYADGFALTQRFISPETGWIASPTVDLNFRTYMIPVPEPSILSLAIGGTLLAATARFRRLRTH